MSASLPENHIPWKSHFVVIQFLLIWLPQNFAHGTATVLSWHVQKFVAIAFLELCWQQNEIIIYDVRIVSEMVRLPCGHVRHLVSSSRKPRVPRSGLLGT